MSPGEMHYQRDLEYQQWHAQQQHAATLAMLAATAAQSATLTKAFQHHVVTSGEATHTMPTYTEVEYDIGRLTGTEIVDVPVPGDFGTTLTIVATLTVDELAFAPHATLRLDPYLHWNLQDSLDGKHWCGLAPPGDNGIRVIGCGEDKYSFIRLNAPFANRLRIRLRPRESDLIKAKPACTDLHCTGITLHLGLQTL
jgi:hypothetical protein